MNLTPFRKAQRIARLYPSLALRDKLAILARLTFCVHPITEVLEKHLPKSGLVIDFGCGYGVFSHLISLSHPDRAVIGIDMSSRRIEIARSGIDCKRSVEFHQADVRTFRIPHCDAVVMIDILYMLSYQDQKMILNRCYESLSDNGVVIVKDNSKSPYWKYIYAYIEDSIKTKLRIYGREIRENRSRYWDVREFTKMVTEIGFHAKMIPLRSYLPYPGVFYVCRKTGDE